MESRWRRDTGLLAKGRGEQENERMLATGKETKEERGKKEEKRRGERRERDGEC